MSKITRDEWLDARRKGIGGSDVAGILGLSKWATPYTVWADKRGELPDSGPNLDMLIGTMLEPWLFQQYKEQTGIECRKSHRILVDKEFDFLLANVDALHKDRVVEFKTARDQDDWGTPGTDQVPTAYLLQCQHYMRVTGKSMCDLGVLFKNNRKPEVVLYSIPRNDELLGVVIPQLAEFWEYVKQGVAPPATTPGDALLKYQYGVPKPIVATSDIESEYLRLVETRKQLSVLTEYEDELKTKLMAFMGECDTLTDAAGRKLTTWKNRKDSARIDLDRLRKDFPDIAAQVTNVVPGTRTFLVKELKNDQ